MDEYWKQQGQDQLAEMRTRMRQTDQRDHTGILLPGDYLVGIGGQRGCGISHGGDVSPLKFKAQKHGFTPKQYHTNARNMKTVSDATVPVHIRDRELSLIQIKVLKMHKQKFCMKRFLFIALGWTAFGRS